ncbi:MAG: hypothetical protein AB8C84_04605 [Oligoflexales bacterium]
MRDLRGLLPPQVSLLTMKTQLRPTRQELLGQLYALERCWDQVVSYLAPHHNYSIYASTLCLERLPSSHSFSFFNQGCVVGPL